MKNLLFLLLFFIGFSACNSGNQESEKKINELQMKLDELTKPAAEKPAAPVSAAPGMIHNVFFWLKKGISDADKAAFLEGVSSLKTVPSVKTCYIGPPAGTEARDVVVNDYSYALIVHFNDEAAEKAYQIDPIHLKFVEDHKNKWTKVVVYDNIVTH